MIHIKTDSAVTTLRRLGANFSFNQVRKVESRAINKTLLQARTIARKEVKAVYNISQKNLNTINTVPSTPSNVTGKLVASRKPIPLDAFAPKQETGRGSIRITRRGEQRTTTFKKKKTTPTAGISIQIYRGKREVIPFAFMIAGGAVRVFARGAYKQGTDYGFVKRNKRVSNDGNDTPIKPLITVSSFGEILNERVIGRIGRQVTVIYPTQLENQVLFMLSTL